jgi:Family of unknown function (DUF5994)
VDGRWWPRSGDLVAEIPVVLAAGFDVRRVTYSLNAWSLTPRRLTIMPGRVAKLGGYAHQDPATITLLNGSGSQRLDLVVIPPPTDVRVAQRALTLTLAAVAGDDHHAAKILHLAQTTDPGRNPRARCVDLFAEQAWDNEGGRVLAS